MYRARESRFYELHLYICDIYLYFNIKLEITRSYTNAFERPASDYSTIEGGAASRQQTCVTTPSALHSGLYATGFYARGHSTTSVAL